MVDYGDICIPIASRIMFTFLDYTSLKGGYNQIYKKNYSWLYNHMTYASLHISHIDLIHIHLFFLVVSESRLSCPKGRAARRSCRPPWTCWMAHCARWRTWSRSAWTAPWATRNARRPAPVAPNGRGWRKGLRQRFGKCDKNQCYIYIYYIYIFTVYIYIHIYIVWKHDEWMMVDKLAIGTVSVCWTSSVRRPHSTSKEYDLSRNHRDP